MNWQDTFGWRSFVLISMLLVAAIQTAHATHLVGGSMYYDHLGGDQYEVHLVIYRDCGPSNTNGTGFDAQAALGIYDGFDLYSTVNVSLDFNSVSVIDLQSGNPCAELPQGVCIERAIYTTVVTLPPSANPYTIVHQRCCRNPLVINLIDAMDTGFTIFATVPSVLGNPDLDVEVNSSPRFDFLPQSYVCLGEPFELPNPATDFDGDSLLYTLGDLFIGGTPTAPSPATPTGPPFDNVTWENGYTPQAPLGVQEADWIEIDPATGTITGTPNTVGKYAVGIYVNEFRQDANGNWMNLGKMIRDFTIDVVACETVVPDITWPEPCTGMDVSFGIEAEQGTFAWDFGLEGETDTSSSATPSFTYAEGGLYTVTLLYDLGGGCGDDVAQSILVAPPVEATFDVLDASCISGAWGQDVNYTGDGPGTTGSLTWLVDGQEAGQGVSPPPLEIPPGSHVVTANLITEVGCEVSHEEAVSLPGLPQAAFTVSTPPCNGLDIGFSNLSSGASSFQWMFDTSDPGTGIGPESTSENPTWSYGNYGSFNAQLIADPGEACADTVVFEVGVFPEDPLLMSFSAIEPQACSMETEVTFIFDGENADDILWDFGSAGSANGDTVVYDFGAAGPYAVELTIANDECGTTQTEAFAVYVPELIAEVELVIPNVLTPNADGKNDRFRVGTRRVDNGTVLPTNTASFSSFKLQVFDRWGVMVHESEGVGAGWDGRVGGSLAAPGAYYYILQADHGCLDADIEEVGQVTLIVD